MGMTCPDAAPPRIEARQLRPARKWYIVAGVIAVLGVMAGAGLGIAGVTSVVRELPDIVAEFDTGEPASVNLTAGRQWAIYAAVGDTGQTIGSHHATCTVAGSAGGKIAVRPVPYEFTFSRAGRSWVAVGEFAVPVDGRYEVSCTSQRGEAAHYAVGEGPELRGFVTGIVGSVAALIGLPCLGLLVAGVIGLVVAVRRSSHRTRLQQAAAADAAADPERRRQPG